MRTSLPGLAVLLLGLTVTPAAADVSGLWHVAGSISGNAFALDCNFTQQGTALGGECTGAKDGNPKYVGKLYKLTKGAVDGAQVSWSYPAHYLFMSFNLNYAGLLSGDHIAGTVEASGRKGDFSATRQ
jgi:hypothetical protein